MKDSLATGIETTRRHTVERDDTIGFMGEDLRVYATPALVGHMEYTCRDFVLEHLDDNEDTVGTRVEIDHMAPTMSGMWVDIKTTIAEIQGRLVTFEFEAWDKVEPVAKGRHMRFIVDKAKTAERLAAKTAKASGGS
jgi:fluoroacetyl-CoA thioesterase